MEAPVSELVALTRCILFWVLLCDLLIGPAIKNACLDLIQGLQSELSFTFNIKGTMLFAAIQSKNKEET